MSDQSERPFDCSVHPKRWQVLTQMSQSLCLKCCQLKWLSPLESDFSRRQLLELLDSSLRYGSHWALQLSREEALAFDLTLLSFLYDSIEPQIQSIANNCLTLIITQFNDQSIEEYIFNDIIEKISSEPNKMNESVLALMTYLLPKEVHKHQLKSDILVLFETLRMDFNKFIYSLKANVLLLFDKYYENSLTIDPLFCLDEGFHRKTLQIVFNSFEVIDDSIKDRKVLINSVLLLKKLSKIESILNSIISNQNLSNYLRLLLSEENEELKVEIFDWICDVLENPNLNRKMANILMNETIDLFVDSLHLSENPLVSNHLLNCVYLILENIVRPIPLSQLKPLSKAVIKTLKCSVDCKDSNFFMLSLSTLRLLLKKNPSTNMMTEFEFFMLIDLFERLLSDSELFVIIVKFLNEFITIFVVPVLVPTKRMKTILNKVLANIANTSTGVVAEDANQCIDRTTVAVDLIKSYLNLINLIKEKEFKVKESVYLLNGQNEYDLNETNSSKLSGITEKDNECKRTEFYDFMAFCLSNVETFFINTFDQLLLEQNSQQFEQNSQLFQSICSCFVIVVENDLFINEDINGFITRMFSNGYVVSLIQMIWFQDYAFITNEFKTCLTSLLSYFLYKLEKYEHRNDVRFKFGLSFSRSTFENSFNQLNGELIERLTTHSCDYQFDDTINKFYNTFFAANYYCFKFDAKKTFKFDVRYKSGFTTILNQYLKYNLSVDSNSVLTVKYSLYLSTLTQLEDKSICALRQFFDRKDNQFLSLYYTNHINFLKWLFNELKCDNFCKFGLNAFFESIPEKFMNFENREIISLFFVLIDSNDRALQLFIDIICDSIASASTLDVIKYLLEDSEQFIDESDICNNWNSFSNKVFEQMPTIIRRIIRKIQTMAAIDLNPREEQTFDKLLNLLCRMLSNDVNKSIFDKQKAQFDRLVSEMCAFIDPDLSDSMIETFFQFFSLCLMSSRDLGLSQRQLTEDILNSKIGLILMINYIDNDLTTNQMKELSLSILSVLTQNNSKYNIEHQLVYDLDLNRIINWISNESKVVSESAFHLLLDSFEIKTYFLSNNKSKEQKIEEMRMLVIQLQNAVFRSNITLNQLSLFLKPVFKDLSEVLPELRTHLANNPWFSVLIEHYIEKNDIFEEEFIDFMVLFFEMDFINKSLIKITNQIVKKFIEAMKSSDPELTTNGVSLRQKVLTLFRIIDSGLYRNVLDIDIRHELTNQSI